jgi:2-keto-3-deoxy-L-rhamnonate aldolase RhmA
VKFIRERVLSREFMAGAWCNLDSALTAEMAARAGFDWVLFDQEHGPGDNESLLRQIQAIEAWPAAPLVRIAWNEMPRFKRVLDLGAVGVMVPYVQNAAEAARAVSFMSYPPTGVRCVASSPRAAGFGRDFETYFKAANEHLLTITQVETGETVKNIDEIAAVNGVDVLFVGPLDLSINLNKPRRFEDPEFMEVLGRVGRAAQNAGKAAGILLPGPELIEPLHGLGFTFVAVGSDGGLVVAGMHRNVQALQAFKAKC